MTENGCIAEDPGGHYLSPSIFRPVRTLAQNKIFLRDDAGRSLDGSASDKPCASLALASSLKHSGESLRPTVSGQVFVTSASTVSKPPVLPLSSGRDTRLRLHMAPTIQAASLTAGLVRWRRFSVLSGFLSWISASLRWYRSRKIVLSGFGAEESVLCYESEFKRVGCRLGAQ